MVDYKSYGKNCWGGGAIKVLSLWQCVDILVCFLMNSTNMNTHLWMYVHFHFSLPRNGNTVSHVESVCLFFLKIDVFIWKSDREKGGGLAAIALFPSASPLSKGHSSQVRPRTQSQELCSGLCMGSRSPNNWASSTFHGVLAGGWTWHFDVNASIIKWRLNPLYCLKVD